MPGRVKRVLWKCRQCEKQKWFIPYIAKTKIFCSLECLRGSQRKSTIVTAKATRTYGERTCEVCSQTYIAKHNHQKCCSLPCSTKKAQQARRKHEVAARACEYCSKEFIPRQDSVGRFCSVPCRDAGRSGPNSGSWKGGRHITGEGYVRIYTGPSKKGRALYRFEHCVVMENHLQRKLTKAETVHHINGNRSDNRIENLQLRTGNHGNGIVMACADCGSHNIISVEIT